ncbi:MAG: hypothetical protein WCX95_02605 [Candidatus Gracilibacteria bacterium]
MPGNGLGGSYSGGTASGENYSPDFGFDRPMSVMPPTPQEQKRLQDQHEREKRQLQGPLEKEREELAEAVSQNLILTSQDVSPLVFGGGSEFFSESPEGNWEYLYERYISAVIEDTLSQNRNFATKLMMTASVELPKHFQLKEMYKRVFDLRGKKDESSKEERRLAIGEIKAILERYSIVFNESSLNKFVRYQALTLISSRVREGVDPEKAIQLKREIAAARTEEEKIAILQKFSSGNPELKAQLEEEVKLLEEDQRQKAEEEKERLAEEAKKKAQGNLEEKAKGTSGAGQVGAEFASVEGGLSPYAYEQARSAIAASGSTYKLSSDGTLRLDRRFSVKLIEKGNGQYSLIDSKYADKEGKSFPLNELAMKAYERFIDAYISLRIRPKLEGSDGISKVQDNQLVTVGKALLGRGDTNGYRVVGDDLKVLDALVDSLLIREKGTTLITRVNSLFEKLRYGMDNKTLAITGEAAAIRTKLLEGKASGTKYSVSELLGERKAES